MSAALIGVFGVVAGALIGSAISIFVQRRQQVLTAARSGRLVAVELDRVVSLMEPTITEGLWWTRPLPSGVWQSHQIEVAAGIDDNLLKVLEEAYDIITSLNTQWPPSASRAKPDDKQKQQLIKSQNYFRATRNRLSKRLITPTRYGRNAIRSFIVIIGVLVLALIVLLAIASFVPRVETSPSAVASALQSKLGPDEYVGCASRPGGWRCDVHYLSAPLSSCLAYGSSSLALNRSLSGGSHLVALDSTSCHETALAKLAVTEEPAGFIATYDDAVVSQGIARGTELIAKEDRKNWIQKAFTALFSAFGTSGG